MLVPGTGSTTLVHLLSPGQVNNDYVHSCLCGKRIKKTTGVCEPAYKFGALDRAFCTKCRSAWPTGLEEQLRPVIRPEIKPPNLAIHPAPKAEQSPSTLIVMTFPTVASP